MTAHVRPPDVALLGRHWSCFHVCGAGAMAAFVATGVVGTRVHRLPFAPFAALSGVSAATFLVVALATKVLLGEERLTCYHHELAVLGACAAYLRVTGQPILAQLDVVATGICAFVAVGRVGCYCVGCCHGRPVRRFGACYGEGHLGGGLAPSLVGVRLVPVQLIESVARVGITVAALVICGRSSRPGVALALVLVGTAVTRLSLEELRGDVRPVLFAVSETQLVTAGVCVAVLAVWRGGYGIPPMVAAIALVDVTLAMALVAAGTRHGSTARRRALRAPAQEAVMLDVIRSTSDVAEGVFALTTPVGAIVSASMSEQGHWALSWPGGSVDVHDARRLATLVVASGSAPGCELSTVVRCGAVHVVRTPRDCALVV